MPVAFIYAIVPVGSYFTAENRHAAYRRKIQRYAKEEIRIWEEVRYGLAYGSQMFINDLKKRYFKGGTKAERPQRNRLWRNTDPRPLAERSALTLGLDLERLKAMRRVSAWMRTRRDMLIYILWDCGRLSNQQIASLLGLNCSSNGSRRIRILEMEMDDDKQLRKEYERIRSRIKV